MNNDDDFTFCQVGGFNNNKDDPEEKKLAKDIDGITTDDGLSRETSSSRDSGSVWKDKSPNNAMTKQETVGSLSFSVTETSSSQQLSKSLGQVDSKNVGRSVNNAKERKAAPRAKVPFEKGYSQMDWLKLTRTHPDLAGLKGQSNKRLISMNEVKQHKTEDSMWTILKGRVYNITPYMQFHPGGVDMLMKAVGKDCTALFNKYHAWVNADFLLEKCLVGILDDSK